MCRWHYWHYVIFFLSSALFADFATTPTPRWGDIRIMHTWNTVPANWESLGSPPAGTTIDLHIALKPQSEDVLIDALYEVSNPRHEKYGAHLTKEQLADLVAPHQETLEIVHSWFEHHGLPSSSISTSFGGGWLTITGVPVSKANELLSASYQLYRHTRVNETEIILRTVSYALPAALHPLVQTVAPTTHFASPRRTPLQTLRKRAGEDAVTMVNPEPGVYGGVLTRPGGVVTPSFLRWLYKTQAYVPSALGRNKLGILGFENDIPIQSDLTQFMANLRADAADATFDTAQVNGGSGYDFNNPLVAANIQIQYAEAMAYPTPHVFYSTGGDLQWALVGGLPVPGDGYLEWLNYLLSKPRRDLPSTVSISYTNPEAGFPRAYLQSLCTLFLRLGLRGVSVLAASGDDGVGRGVGTGGACIDADGSSSTQAQEFAHQTATISFAGPWVTSVGGTTSHDPEVAAPFSGGGFSFQFARPRYQTPVVSPYLEYLGGEKYVTLYRPTGRGIPDISAQAQRFPYVMNDFLYETTGTLCAVATAAGVVSLLNDYLYSKKQPPLGFLNPWLYGHGLQSLNDIASGSNPGCGTDGFASIEGWDPVTGLGTLDFEILQLVLDSDIESDSDDAK